MIGLYSLPPEGNVLMFVLLEFCKKKPTVFRCAWALESRISKFLMHAFYVQVEKGFNLLTGTDGKC